jgi:alpha-ketoglutarate-dependent taurine dioxygenase
MAQLELRPLHPAVGVEVVGLTPRLPLDRDTLHQLRAAFDDRSVLVFRDLDIDEDFQRHLVFGLIGFPPGTDKWRDDAPSLVSNKEERALAPYGRLLFHCDNMWARKHQEVLSLYGLEVEPPIAPTSYVSMGHGWDTLPRELRTRVEGLEARHGFDTKYPNRGGDEDVADGYYAHPVSRVQPVAYRHPRTGRTLLYVSQQATIEILGLSPDENEDLLAALFAHLYAPDNVLDHDWREGDLVVWDNVATQHGRANVVLDGRARTLRKVTGPLNLDPDEIVAPVFSKVAGR